MFFLLRVTSEVYCITLEIRHILLKYIIFEYNLGWRPSDTFKLDIDSTSVKTHIAVKSVIFKNHSRINDIPQEYRRLSLVVLFEFLVVKSGIIVIKETYLIHIRAPVFFQLECELFILLLVDAFKIRNDLIYSRLVKLLIIREKGSWSVNHVVENGIFSEFNHSIKVMHCHHNTPIDRKILPQLIKAC
jgi:hypothetical protein